MTEAWKSTPGRDAMTRDGRRVTNLRVNPAHKPGDMFSELVGGVEIGELAWDTTGRHCGIRPCSFDLVADADPLPATGPVRERTIREIVPGVYGRLRIEGYAPDEGVAVRLVDRNGDGTHGLTHNLTASELDAMIATLTAIRDAMEDKP